MSADSEQRRAETPASASLRAAELGLRSRTVRVVLTLVSVALVIYIVERVYTLGAMLGGLLSTLAGALLLALLARPLIGFFRRLSLPRAVTDRLTERIGASRARRLSRVQLSFGLSVALAYAVVLVVLVGLLSIAVATIIPQAADFIARLPEIAANFPEQFDKAVADVLMRFGVSLGALPPLISPIEAATELRRLAGAVAAQTVLFATSTAGFLGQLFFAFILSVYITFEGRMVRRQFFEVLPRRAHESVAAFLDAANLAFSGYLNGTFLAALAQGLVTVALFAFFGVPFGFVVGVVFALLSFIPLIGSPIAIIIAVAVTLFFKPQAALPIGLVLLFVNQVIAYGLLPRLLHNTVGVPSLIQLVAVAIGTQLFGFWGLVFSIPFMGALYGVVFKFYLPRRRASEPAAGAATPSAEAPNPAVARAARTLHPPSAPSSEALAGRESA